MNTIKKQLIHGTLVKVKPGAIIKIYVKKYSVKITQCIKYTFFYKIYLLEFFASFERIRW